ncbi:CGNR zinc finger domain-containing protein [Parafrankia elaeagni]|uniref:CGNR zinc finger domain-containing protein n=1 Tax=Parafrankia elaeagni TaxID=222534 RepID=UPI0009FC583D|nr:CGNR zinc finger domain-containing protein [Parafrankia elaeagni]
MHGAHLAADLANLERNAPAHLVRAVLRRHAVAEAEIDNDAARADLLRWADRLNACFGLSAGNRLYGLVNDLLAESTGSPYISAHDGRPHLHYRMPDSGVVARIRAITSSGLAQVICGDGADRLGRCEREGCEVTFVDVSRNGRRSYCSARCANTAAVARHRATATAR